MAYDFSQAVNAAKAIADRSEGQATPTYKYPLVYPQPGQTIVVRPLFNPKSNSIVRLINRHEKIPCYRSYGFKKEECPICKVQEDVKNLTGTDPFGRTSASKARGICFAQFISSTIPVEKGQNKGVLQPGELILFMFPWSVYTQINTQITAVAQTPTGMDQAFCHASQGLFVQVSVTNDYKYTTTNVPYMTFNPSNLTDEQFLAQLDGMDNLNDQVIPATLTDEVVAQFK